MIDSIFNHEGTWRLAIFLILFLIMVVWETLLPRRDTTNNTRIRQFNNLGIMLTYTLLIRFAVPLLPVGAALYAAEHSFGVFNSFQLPALLTAILAVVILDMVIYSQHRIFHKVPLLWKLHRMHHTDIEFDVTTGIRFHPIEIILSLAIKIIIVMLLGAPAIAVLFFEILLSSAALFNHSNIRLPMKIDSALRWVLVTPDMHRVHHSVHKDETDSNFGFSVPWWDRLFGTYRAQPKDGHTTMNIGIESFRDTTDSRIDQMLIQPFK